MMGNFISANSHRLNIAMIDLLFLIQQSRAPLQGSLDQKEMHCDQVCIDSRAITSPNALFVALAGTRTDGHNFLLDAEKRGARFALVNRSYESKTAFEQLLLIPADDPLTALQQLARHHRMRTGVKIVAIAGTSGKTEVKDLLYHILKARFCCCCSAESFNSQIGVALSLLKIGPFHEVAIIECGVSRRGEMQILADLVCPDFAILTNIEDKYCGAFGSLASIYLEKIRLLEAVRKGGWSLLPKSTEKFLAQKKIGTLSDWNNWDATALNICSNFANYHSINKELVQLAVRAAQLLGLSHSLVVTGLLSYKHQMMHLEMWRTFSGSILINDLYCADFASLGKTVDWAQLFARKGGKKILWFSGLKDRKIDRSAATLQEVIGRFGIDEIYLGNPLKKNRQKGDLKALCSSLSASDLIIFRGAQKLNPQQLARQIGSPLPPATLQIDLTAIAHNVRVICASLDPKTTILAMLKAQAYGTDGEIMARFLMHCGIDYFGLATVDEAMSLRRAGILEKLLVLHATPMQWDAIIEHDLQICVSQKQEIYGLGHCAKRAKKVVKLHLHIDIGMSRLGCTLAQALPLATLIKQHPHLQLEGVMGHLVSADEPSQADFTNEQCALFETLLKTLDRAAIDFRYAHLANSAGAFTISKSSCNLIRIGLGLFGLTSPDLHPHLLLKPALSLEAEIAHLHTIKRGQSVSYGRRYIAEREKERIAVIPLGYADGLRRDFGTSSVVVKGQKAPIVGTICMDFTMCDVTHISGVRTGDRAKIFGFDHSINHSAHHLARELKISAHEIIATLGPRIQRLFTFDRKPIFP